MEEYKGVLTPQQKANLVMTNRSYVKDTPELQKARLMFISKLSNYDPSIKVCEMYPCAEVEDGSIKSYFDFYQYADEGNFNNCNTRTQLKTQTSLEIDKLPQEVAIPLICETARSLIRANIHFYCFNAEGGRSPYLIIYDWKELGELDDFQRIKAQIQFWRKHVPFGMFHYIDTGMFDREHLHPLEFAPHWKHKEIFNLIFEYNPEDYQKTYYDNNFSWDNIKVIPIDEETKEQKFKRYEESTKILAYSYEDVKKKKEAMHKKHIEIVNNYLEGLKCNQ